MHEIRDPGFLLQGVTILRILPYREKCISVEIQKAPKNLKYNRFIFEGKTNGNVSNRY